MPNGDLSEMKSGKPSQPGASGLLISARDLPEAMREMGIGEQRRKMFNPEVSVGNLLTLGALIVGAIIAYGEYTSSQTVIGGKLDAIDSRLELQDKRMDGQDATIKERRAYVDSKLESGDRTRVLSEQTARDLGNVATMLKEFGDQLKEGRTKRENGLDTSAREAADNRQSLALLSDRFDRVAREVKELRELVLTGGRRDGSAPFGRDQSWPGPTLPFSLKARTECLEPLSPIVRRMALGKEVLARRG